MTKSKPTQVIVHRIELQQKERELFENALTAYSVNKLVNPITNLSPSGLVALAALGIFTIDKILDGIGLDPDWKEIVKDMTPDQVKDWLETQNLVGAAAGGLVGLLFGGLGGAVVGAVGGSAAVEVAEPFYQHQQDTFEAAGVQRPIDVGWIAALISLKQALT